LPSPTLQLWRNTVQLFYEYKHVGFVGPFKRAGLRFLAESLMRTVEGKEKRPDIIASGDEGWLALELTTNPESKAPKLVQYATLVPEYLGMHGLLVHKIPPDVISSRLIFVDDGTFCQISVSANLQVVKLEHIKSERLRAALRESNGVSLAKLPAIPITILPGMKSSELREGLVDIVMQLFSPGGQGKTPKEITDEGLERLADKLGVNDRHALIGRVEKELNGLIKQNLKGYLEFVDGSYRPTADWRENYASRELIAKRLREWTAQKQLGDFQPN
jgi:hypothetical protein